MKRTLTIVAIVIVVAAALIAWADAGWPFPGRYQIISTNPGQAWRLDTATGAMLSCVGLPRQNVECWAWK